MAQNSSVAKHAANAKILYKLYDLCVCIFILLTLFY